MQTIVPLYLDSDSDFVVTVKKKRKFQTISNCTKHMTKHIVNNKICCLLLITYHRPLPVSNAFPEFLSIQRHRNLPNTLGCSKSI